MRTKSHNTETMTQPNTDSHVFFNRWVRTAQISWIYYATYLAIAVGLCLAVISWLHICSEACSEGHNYRLYGMKFETVGIPFFAVLAFAQAFARRSKLMHLLVVTSLSGAMGAEAMFIYAQKYIIGHWCPVCLGIAAAVAVAFLLCFVEFYMVISALKSYRQKGEMMKSVYKVAFCIMMAICGFLFSHAGFAKFNQLQAAENDIKDSIAFGNLKSPIEVYVFTDWECPSCRKVEPVLEEASPELMKKVRLIYVDLPVHPESMNYTPYNLSFMINNKDKYFRIRDILTDLSLKTGTPTDAQVEEAVGKIGVKYHQLNYSDVAVGIKYFKHVTKQFDVDRTPTVVIVNKDKKKGKKLIGATEITEENIMKAIDSLSN